MAQFPTPSPRAIPTPFGTPDANGHVHVNLPAEPPPGMHIDPRLYARERAMCQMIADKQYFKQPVDWEQLGDCGRLRITVWVYSQPRPLAETNQPPQGMIVSPSPTPLPTP